MDTRRLLAALAFAAFTAAPVHAAAPQGDYGAFASENALTDDWGVYDEDFAWDSDEAWFDDWSVGDDWAGYGDDLGFDDYGAFDRDYTWRGDEDFGPWQEQAHYDWLGYDDAGEEGWFDF